MVGVRVKQSLKPFKTDLIASCVLICAPAAGGGKGCMGGVSMHAHAAGAPHQRAELHSWASALRPDLLHSLQ